MTRARAVASLAIALPSVALAVVATVACEQALSIDGTVTVVPHEACGLSVPAGGCQSCVASECCAQASACAADAPCATYESCLLACGTDYNCRTDCALTAPSGKGTTVPALDLCVASRCNDACGMSCGLTASPSIPDAAAACASCIASKACNAVKACATSSSCEAIEHCLPGCATIDCHDTCLAGDDAGLFTALEVGVASACLRDCAVGQLWLCVGRVNWPLAPAGVNEVDFSVVDSMSSKPLPGAMVRACAREDQTCAPPQAQATADAMGKGALLMPAHAAIGLGFDGYYAIDAAGEMPWRIFASSPVTLAHAPFNWTVGSMASFQSTIAGVGLTPDPTRGQIILDAADCVQSPAAGVSFKVTDGAGADLSKSVYYLSGGALNNVATETDFTGAGVLFNVPAGSLTVQAIPKAIGKASSTEGVLSLPGAVSTLILLPTP